MKNFLTLMAVALMVTTVSHAQSAVELAKQQRELDKINMSMINSKPSKEAKKQAKKMAKEGWLAPAGSDDLASQLTRGQLLGKELMADENGQPVKRYILHTAMTTSGSESAGYAAARTQCQMEIASMLKTKVAGAIESKLDNAETSAINASTVDKFHQRSKGIIDATLTMMTPVIHIYRVLPNNNYQVQVQVAYDKKEMKAMLKRQLVKQLEQEGDELDDIVDEVLGGDFE